MTSKYSKPFKEFVKWVLRNIIRVRVNYFSLDNDQAEFWADTIKKWPAIIKDDDLLKLEEIDPGISLELGVVDVIQRTLRVTGRWEPHVYGAINRYLNRGDTFLDIGANIGYFTLSAAKIVGSEGRVVALEPSVRPLQRLVRHVYINNAKNVMLFSVGASNTSGVKTLHWATPSNIGASSTVSLERSESELIPVIKIDNLLVEYGITPDVVKIDVEGGEFEVIEGMKNFLEETPPIVICELNNDFLRKSGKSINQVIVYMSGFGYRCYRLLDDSSMRETELSHNGDHSSGQIDVVFKPNRI